MENLAVVPTYKYYCGIITFCLLHPAILTPPEAALDLIRKQQIMLQSIIRLCKLDTYYVKMKYATALMSIFSFST